MATPQKNRDRRKNQSSVSQAPQHINPSDYDSEAAPYIEPIPTRTNTDLNLSVLRRYVPNITDIPSLASHAEVYIFVPASEQWERAEISGTIFICNLNHGSGYCIVILNKKSMENLIIDMREMLNVEITTEFLIIHFLDKGEGKILGLFVQDAPEGTRESICEMVKGIWSRTEEQGDVPQSQIQIHKDSVDEQRATPVVGQRLNLSELFGRQDGAR